MAVYPKIDSPCPYADRLETVVADGFCRMCKRDVHDLSGMDDDARLAFVAACGREEVCVSYRIPRSLAAAVIAASAVAAMPAAAQTRQTDETSAPVPASPSEHDAADEDDVVIVVAGRIAPQVPIDARPVVAISALPPERDRRRARTRRPDR